MVTLDTTILVDWYDAPFDRLSEEMQDLVQRDDLHWDEYVVHQLRANLFMGAAAAYNALLDEDYDPVGAQFALDSYSNRFGFGPTPNQRRLAKNLILCFEDKLCDPDVRLSKTERGQLIARHIKQKLKPRILKNPKKEKRAMQTDYAGCRRSDYQFVFTKEGGCVPTEKPSCSKNDLKPCKIEEFWRQRRTHLNSVGTIDDPPTRHIGLCRSARNGEAKLKPGRYCKALRGMGCTKDLSDMVIYLTAAESKQVATTNVQDFQFIKEATKHDIEVMPIPARR